MGGAAECLLACYHSSCSYAVMSPRATLQAMRVTTSGGVHDSQHPPHPGQSKGMTSCTGWLILIVQLLKDNSPDLVVSSWTQFFNPSLLPHVPWLAKTRSIHRPPHQAAHATIKFQHIPFSRAPPPCHVHAKFHGYGLCFFSSLLQPLIHSLSYQWGI
jgi:hypothetical protein